MDALDDKPEIFKKMCFFGHIIKKREIERCIIEGKVAGKRRRGRLQVTWACDVVKFVGESLVDVVHQDVD